MEDINTRIRHEVCHGALNELRDENLMTEYINCNSVKIERKKLGNVLEKYVDQEIAQQIIQEYLLDLIPAGTKGVIRGNKFNKIVKNTIETLSLDVEKFDVSFEKICDRHFTSEVPDWYILEKTTNRIIIGMNQLDLWSGGHQLNRGFNYIDSKHNTENSKLLCVVCNEIQFKTKNKAYKLFESGFEHNTLCYLNNLQNIITTYFQILD